MTSTTSARLPKKRITVIGAGAVGTCVALELVRRGHDVTMLDGGQAGSGASLGNSGMLVADTAMPTALPGMTMKIPGWLFDPDGPLVVNPRYLTKAAPWLWQYWLSATRKKVFKTSMALRALHNPTLRLWREMVGDEAMDRYTRHLGQIYLWEGNAGPDPHSLESIIRGRYGVESEPLDRTRLQSLLPGLASNIRVGLLLPGNGHTINPLLLVRAATERFVGSGGKLSHEQVQGLWREEHGRWRIITNLNNHISDHVVVAAGAWSSRLLSPLKIRIPLETERGYHVMLRSSSVQVPLPVLNKSGYYGLSSMEGGLRVSGTVEIAGLEAPMRIDRAKRLIKQVERLFPDLRYDDQTYWMGHRPSTPDGLPVIGSIKGQPGLYVCFGHAHSGLTAAPASAVLLADLLSDHKPSIDPAPYAPERF